MGIPWGFDGANGVGTRPVHAAASSLWAKDESAPGANNGTRLTASLMNRVVGNIRRLAEVADIGLTETSDNDLVLAVLALIGATAPAAHNHDDVYYTETETDALLGEKAPLASPTFTGVPEAPTADLGTNTTQIATMAALQAAIADLINSAPGALDTLAELSAALGDDADFAATMTTALAGKQGIHTNLTAIAALTTQAFGLSLLTAADAAALRTLAEAYSAGQVDALLSAKAPLASPTFTGNPAAPTQSPADSSTKIATTAYVDTAVGASIPDASTTVKGKVELTDNTEALAGSDATRAVTSAGLASGKSLAADGYMKMPGGLIVQWGTVSGSAGTVETFPIAFPTACFALAMTPSADSRIPGYASLTASQFSYTCVTAGGGASGQASTYIAIGY